MEDALAADAAEPGNKHCSDYSGHHRRLNGVAVGVVKQTGSDCDGCEVDRRGVRSVRNDSVSVASSRRGSIVISPTNGDINVGHKNPTNTGSRVGLHVQFHHTTLDGTPLTENLQGSTSSLASSSSDDDSSSGQLSEARAPDGGWGWVVVLAAFLVNLIADGITFSFGVIFVEFLHYFGEGKSKTAWIGSLFMAMPLLSGPVASFLTDRYGCRKVTIAGALLATTGFVVSSFTNSMELLFFTFGVVAGFGLSLCYVAAVVIVAYYFDRRRSFATGLSVCGSGIGTFIFAPLTHFLLAEYGWRGTTLILAGLFLNMCVCGALMRDLECTRTRAQVRRKERKTRRHRTGGSSGGESVESIQQTPTSCPSVDELRRLLQKPVSYDEKCAGSEGSMPGGAGEGAGANRLCSSLVSLPTFVRNGERVPLEVLEGLTNHRHLYTVLLHNYPSLLISSRSFSDSGRLHDQVSCCSFSDSGRLHDQQSCGSMREQLSARFVGTPGLQHRGGGHAKPTKLAQDTETAERSRGGEKQGRLPTAAYLKDLRVHRHSLTYRGAMLNINRYRLRASSCPDIYRNSMTTIAKEKVEWYAGLWELWYLLADMLDLSHFANVRFLLFAASNFLLYTWYDVPYVYLTDNAIEHGFSETDASFLISVIGILNMVGEIVLGWMGDRAWVNAGLVYAVSMALCGAVVALVPLLHSYEALCAVSGAFGLFIAANYSLTSIILVELITLERFTNAYGLLLLVQGIANLVGPPLAGWLYDITGSYSWSFYLAGIFIALSGALLVVHPSVEKVRSCRKLHRCRPDEEAQRIAPPLHQEKITNHV